MPRIRYQFTVTLDSDEELSDASKDVLAAALARAVPGARRIICARAGSADPDDEAAQPSQPSQGGRPDLN